MKAERDLSTLADLFRDASLRQLDDLGLSLKEALQVEAALRDRAPSALNSGPALTELDFPVGAKFAFMDEPGEHDPCYVVMPGGAALAVNHHATPGVDIARAKFIVNACNAAFTAEKDDDETYEIGKRDGYSDAVQQIDVLTGGDGEYRYCTDGDPDRHTPDPATMIQRIVDRFNEVSRSAASTVEPVAQVMEMQAALKAIHDFTDCHYARDVAANALEQNAAPTTSPEPDAVRKALIDLLKACVIYDDEPDSAVNVARYQSAVASASAVLSVPRNDRVTSQPITDGDAK